MSIDTEHIHKSGRREEELFLRGAVELWAMALLGLGKEGGKMMDAAFGKERNIGSGEHGPAQALSLMQCPRVAAVALCVRPSFPSH